MPLDFNYTKHYNPMSGLDIPDYLNFRTHKEPTRMQGKDYIVNNEDGTVYSVTGSKMNYVDHIDYFPPVYEAIDNFFGADGMQGVQFKWNTARNNAFAMLDIVLPNTKGFITTPKHRTEVSQRIIALHGIDGLCSNQVFFGAIDLFCTNGQIGGEHDKVRRKNTTNFNMDTFIRELENSVTDFYKHVELLQKWADTSTLHVDIKTMLESVIKSERKAEKMYSLYNEEASKRGHNAFALYSAFTNYATYADERNGFSLRNTGNDTNSVSMWLREQEVNKWVSTPQFKALVAA